MVTYQLAVHEGYSDRPGPGLVVRLQRSSAWDVLPEAGDHVKISDKLGSLGVRGRLVDPWSGWASILLSDFWCCGEDRGDIVDVLREEGWA